MKRFFPILLLLSAPIAWPQVNTGTVFYVDLAKDEFTIAADSRMTRSDGSYDDTECKILAFGNQFVLVMAGAVKGANWNAHATARIVWETESAKQSDPVKLVPTVAEKWAVEMEAIYREPSIIQDLRRMRSEIWKEADSGALANAVFAATNDSGGMIAYGMDIEYDPELFTSRNIVRVTHHSEIARSGTLTGGRDEVITEFSDQTSAHAKDYMKWFTPQMLSLPRTRMHAVFASKLIELTILLHPHASELGFPIDVLQLRRRTGVVWISVKPNCQKE